ncbi:hypothetical protein C8F04DRAFT_1286628 [Mycena alexandri]|uniref:Uncharacterized protein n=1 Tax=Mycena alexandri TaxID=1745969 RepID=A0AAD6XK29_9AGAR|nr:hypothetical protein C8F04DRAFT_1286628 [Mycena alexandri]
MVGPEPTTREHEDGDEALTRPRERKNSPQTNLELEAAQCLKLQALKPPSQVVRVLKVSSPKPPKNSRVKTPQDLGGKPLKNQDASRLPRKIQDLKMGQDFLNTPRGQDPRPQGFKILKTRVNNADRSKTSVGDCSRFKLKTPQDSRCQKPSVGHCSKFKPQWETAQDPRAKTPKPQWETAHGRGDVLQVGLDRLET